MRVVVVGAGVMGSWTALWLRRRGHDAVLIDRFGPANALSSSGDLSRISRSAHARDRHYPRWQRRALTQWLSLEREAGTSLFLRTGALWFAHDDIGFEAESLDTLGVLEIPAERWSREDLRRIPGIAPRDVEWALFEPEAGALLARRAVAAVADQFVAEGGRLEIGSVDTASLEADRSQTDRVLLADGRTIDAEAVVFACGPWLPQLFPDVLGELITATRQEVFHFAPPPGDARFTAGAMPVWIDYGRSFYGVPSIEGAGFKCCPDWLGSAVDDPEGIDRRVGDAGVLAVRAYLRDRFPDLADRPVSQAWACLYESTPDANFLIDRHPSLSNVWLVGGGSGHGFKHGPVIGEYVSALVTDDEGAVAELAPLDDRFALGPRASATGFRSLGRAPVQPAGRPPVEPAGRLG